MAKILKVRNADNTAWVEIASSVPDTSVLASKTYVDNAIADLVDTAPTTLDTLNELAQALGEDANFATTVTNALAQKASTGKAIAVSLIFGG